MTEELIQKLRSLRNLLDSQLPRQNAHPPPVSATHHHKNKKDSNQKLKTLSDKPSKHDSTVEKRKKQLKSQKEKREFDKYKIGTLFESFLDEKEKNNQPHNVKSPHRSRSPSPTGTFKPQKKNPKKVIKHQKFVYEEADVPKKTAKTIAYVPSVAKRSESTKTKETKPHVSLMQRNINQQKYNNLEKPVKDSTNPNMSNKPQSSFKSKYTLTNPPAPITTNKYKSKEETNYKQKLSSSSSSSSINLKEILNQAKRTRKISSSSSSDYGIPTNRRKIPNKIPEIVNSSSSSEEIKKHIGAKKYAFLKKYEDSSDDIPEMKVKSKPKTKNPIKSVSNPKGKSKTNARIARIIEKIETDSSSDSEINIKKPKNKSPKRQLKICNMIEMHSPPQDSPTKSKLRNEPKQEVKSSKYAYIMSSSDDEPDFKQKPLNKKLDSSSGSNKKLSLPTSKATTENKISPKKLLMSSSSSDIEPFILSKSKNSSGKASSKLDSPNLTAQKKKPLESSSDSDFDIKLAQKANVASPKISPKLSKANDYLSSDDNNVTTKSFGDKNKTEVSAPNMSSQYGIKKLAELGISSESSSDDYLKAYKPKTGNQSKVINQTDKDSKYHVSSSDSDDIGKYTKITSKKEKSPEPEKLLPKKQFTTDLSSDSDIVIPKKTSPTKPDMKISSSDSEPLPPKKTTPIKSFADFSSSSSEPLPPKKESPIKQLDNQDSSDSVPLNPKKSSPTKPLNEKASLPTKSIVSSSSSDSIDLKIPSKTSQIKQMDNIVSSDDEPLNPKKFTPTNVKTNISSSDSETLIPKKTSPAKSLNISTSSDSDLIAPKNTTVPQVKVSLSSSDSKPISPKKSSPLKQIDNLDSSDSEDLISKKMSPIKQLDDFDSSDSETFIPKKTSPSKPIVTSSSDSEPLPSKATIPIQSVQISSSSDSDLVIPKKGSPNHDKPESLINVPKASGPVSKASYHFTSSDSENEPTKDNEKSQISNQSIHSNKVSTNYLVDSDGDSEPVQITTPKKDNSIATKPNDIDALKNALMSSSDSDDIAPNLKDDVVTKPTGSNDIEESSSDEDFISKHNITNPPNLDDSSDDEIKALINDSKVEQLKKANLSISDSSDDDLILKQEITPKIDLNKSSDSDIDLEPPVPSREAKSEDSDDSELDEDTKQLVKKYQPKATTSIHSDDEKLQFNKGDESVKKTVDSIVITSTDDDDYNVEPVINIKKINEEEDQIEIFEEEEEEDIPSEEETSMPIKPDNLMIEVTIPKDDDLFNLTSPKHSLTPSPVSSKKAEYESINDESSDGLQVQDNLSPSDLMKISTTDSFKITNDDNQEEDILEENEQEEEEEILDDEEANAEPVIKIASKYDLIKPFNRLPTPRPSVPVSSSSDADDTHGPSSITFKPTPSAQARLKPNIPMIPIPKKSADTDEIRAPRVNSSPVINLSAIIDNDNEEENINLIIEEEEEEEEINEEIVVDMELNGGQTNPYDSLKDVLDSNNSDNELLSPYKDDEENNNQIVIDANKLSLSDDSDENKEVGQAGLNQDQDLFNGISDEDDDDKDVLDSNIISKQMNLDNNGDSDEDVDYQFDDNENNSNAIKDTSNKIDTELPGQSIDLDDNSGDFDVDEALKNISDLSDDDDIPTHEQNHITNPDIKDALGDEFGDSEEENIDVDIGLEDEQKIIINSDEDDFNPDDEGLNNDNEDLDIIAQNNNPVDSDEEDSDSEIDMEEFMKKHNISIDVDDDDSEDDV